MTTHVRPRTQRPSRLVPLVVALLTAAALGSVTAADLDTSAQVDLPVTRVVLFSTGVAYVEHAGRVDGDAALELRVPSAAMDDLLQSLVVADLGGGRVEGVRYGARDPLARILASYPIDLSRDPSLAELLAQARGERVRVTSDVTRSGVILGVERVVAPDRTPRSYLTLATEAGLTRIDLEEVRELRFENEALRAALDAALAAIAEYRDGDDVPVRVLFSGEGVRDVRVGYLREMPVWKTSYRLTLAGDGSADLQGWAIFDNPTSLDFERVSLSFVAGRPASFVSRLYEPVYAPRERVDVTLASGFVPPTDAGAVASEVARSMMAMPSAPAMADAAFADTAFGGDGGVEALAEGRAGGATFSYVVREPVTVARYESVLVPILRADVSAFDVSLFAPGTAGQHPLRALRLVNDSGAHLAAGPVTIFDAQGFTGSALLADTVPGDERLLAYAVDLELAVDVTSRSEPEQVVAVRFEQGLLVSEHRSRVVTRYVVDPRAEVTRFVVIEQARRGGYEVVSPAPAPAVTETAYRFGVALVREGDDTPSDPGIPMHARCDASGACAFEVVLERVESRRVAVSNVPLERIDVYLQELDLSETTRAQLEAIAVLQRDIVRLDRAVSAERGRRAAIADDQARIRQNMAELDRDGQLYQRYVAELTAQEDELLAIVERIAALEAERAERQADLDVLVRSLGR